MQLTYDLSRYGIPDGQIVLGGIYNFDTWEPAGPNALSLATLSYYQTFLNKQVELKLGYINNVFEFWSLFLAGNLASSIFGPSGNIPVEVGISAPAFATPGINIKINAPEGFYNKVGIQRASSPDGPFAEKAANPTGLKWSTPNSGVLVINEVGYRKEAAPGQLAAWVSAAPMFNTSRYIDFDVGGRNTGNYGAYFLADHLLGAGPQSAAWLNVSSRFGLAAATVGYALLTSGKPTKGSIELSPRPAIFWSVAIVIIVVCALGRFKSRVDRAAL